LIHGIPGQTVAKLEADLAAIDDLSPDHVSWYELGVVEGTPLARRLGETVGDAAEDAHASLYRHVVRGLQRRGYRWYEVSNFARPGRRRAPQRGVLGAARPYLGLGPER